MQRAGPQRLRESCVYPEAMISLDDPAGSDGTRGRIRRRHRVRRHIGTALIVAGTAMLAWGFVVWKWNDPFTSVYTARAQQRLEGELQRTISAVSVQPLPVAPTPAARRNALAVEARRFRSRTGSGDAIGRIVVPRLGLSMVLVNGTDQNSLKAGPGRDLRTFMPGEGELVYVAGHRTTYKAPFARIDRMRPGDQITLVMPYGTIRYAVRRSQIVDADELSVLTTHHREELALQACHPRFFASQRYIVWAVPIRFAIRGGPTFVPA